MAYPQLLLNNKFINISWKQAFLVFIRILYLFKNNFIECFFGSFLDLETGITLKYFLNNFGCSRIWSLDDFFSFVDFRCYFQLNETLIDIERKNNILFVGTNLRLEAPLLNARIRKSYLTNSLFNAYSFGLSINYLTYPVLNLGIVYILLLVI